MRLLTVFQRCRIWENTEHRYIEDIQIDAFTNAIA